MTILEQQIEKQKNMQQKIVPWINLNFLFLWIGSIISNFGLQMYMVTIPLLIYHMSKSPLAMSTMRAVEFFPNILLGLIAGVFIDRFYRKKIMSVMTLIQLFFVGALLLLLWIDQLLIWHLFIIGFFLSAANFTFINTQHSIVPLIVEKNQLTEANAKLTLVYTVVNLIGPGIAGILLAVYSYKISFAIYFVCLFLMFFTVNLVRLDKNSVPKKEKSSVIKEIKEGLFELFGNKTLLIPTIVILIINFSASLIIGINIFYATEYLGASERQIGYILSISAVGGLISSLIVPKITKTIARGKIFVYSLLFDALGVFFLLISTSWWVMAIGLFIRLFGVTTMSIIYLTIRQELTPNHLLGRVTSSSSMLMRLAAPLGLFVSGIWAEYYSVKNIYIFSIAIVICLFVILSTHKIRHFK
ncbi:MFS transporter [Bacillus aquiflavi]|uniref:MFS transporter n=1 Tax=Bacillus aquiflavi TaxID=2672567 RepID=UPI001CA87B0C|nr:MFS transporter [Bacillus aquiflavi]UAC49552.1 MFS transporter [Bacillus aquiflavi]